MRLITIGLLAASFGIQGCDAPAENKAPSDPGSNMAGDMGNATNAAEPVNAQVDPSNEANGASRGADAPPCSPAPSVTPCPSGVGQGPTVAPPPTAATVTPQVR